MLPDKPATIVDPGPDTPGARSALEEGCRGLGLALADVQRVVVTHTHLDHCGLAAWLHVRSGAPVLCHVSAVATLTQFPEAWSRRVELLRRAAVAGGFPEDLIDAMVAEQRQRAPLAVPVAAEALQPLDDGRRVELGAANWTVLHTPGHARDHVCLFHGPSGGLASGDLLLRKLATPAWLEDRRSDGSRPTTLADLLTSWARLSRLPVTIAWPGHGREIRAHRILIARRTAAARTQLRAARRAVRHGASTLCELADALELDVSPEGLPATLGDAVAMADYLVERQLVTRRVEDGVVRFGR